MVDVDKSPLLQKQFYTLHLFYIMLLLSRNQDEPAQFSAAPTIVGNFNFGEN